MSIIGILGKAGSGKDTVADYILKCNASVKVSLADPIKRIAKDIWNFSDEQLWGPSEYRNAPDKRYPLKNGEYLTPRKVLQHLGTEGTRAIDSDVWIRYFIKTAKQLLTENDLYYLAPIGIIPNNNYYSGNRIKTVICADCRFINEIYIIKYNKGSLLKIVRPNTGLKGDFGLHQSEVEMDQIPDSDFDMIIENSGTIEDLKNNVNLFIEKYIEE